jgi:hypothetical protein
MYREKGFPYTNLYSHNKGMVRWSLTVSLRFIAKQAKVPLLISFNLYTIIICQQQHRIQSHKIDMAKQPKSNTTKKGGKDVDVWRPKGPDAAQWLKNIARGDLIWGDRGDSLKEFLRVNKSFAERYGIYNDDFVTYHNRYRNLSTNLRKLQDKFVHWLRYGGDAGSK